MYFPLSSYYSSKVGDGFLKVSKISIGLIRFHKHFYDLIVDGVAADKDGILQARGVYSSSLPDSILFRLGV